MKNFVSALFLVFGVLLLSSFGLGKKEIVPPGTVKLKENFYFDQTEVRNLDYREYLYWQSAVFGQNSEEFKNALPDTNVWACVNIVFIEKYLRHPAYMNFPVVGVSYEQAKAYCKWRSDRVYEWMMVEKKAIDWTIKKNKDTLFTIENFISGKYPSKKKMDKKDLYPVPEYNLPTMEEWKFAASSGLDVEKYEFGIRDISKIEFNTKEMHGDYAINVEKNPKNDFKIYGMTGNVSEIVLEKNISKGGSWFHTKDESKIKKEISYSKPEAWLGFRCMCKMKYE